jgi:hypothetical protein
MIQLQTRPHLARVLALVSGAAIVVSVIATVIGHVGLGPTYDPLALTLSDYALSDRGAAIELAMVALGAGSLLLTGGLLAAGLPARGTPAVLLAVWGIGLLVAAVVPTDRVGATALSTAGHIHRYASVLAFVSLPAAGLVLVPRLRAVGHWRGAARGIRPLAAASGVGLVMMLYVAFPGDRVMLGLVERGLLVVEVALLALLAVRLRQLAAAPVAAPPCPIGLAPATRSQMPAEGRARACDLASAMSG